MKTELCGVCLALLLTACGGPAEENRALPVVSVAQAEAVTGSGSRNYTFISEPCRTTELAFRVGGPVQNFTVQSGQFFRKGQLIAAIDPRDFLIRKERAEALCRQAEADYRRTASLYEKNNVSGTAYEKARAGYGRARADLDMALNELNDTRLTAPFDGYVQQVCIERHQEVKASQPVLTFIDLSQVRLETYVPEDMAVSLRRGVLDSVFQVRFDRLPGQEFTPVETYLTQTAADNNLSFRLTLLLDNPDNSLLGGMAGSLSISLPLTSASLPSLAIPQAAVCLDDCRGSYVWTVEDDGSVNRCPVTLGRLLKDSRVEVVSGLKAGQQVAVTRQAYLNEVANAAYGPQSNYAQCLVEAESPSVARQMQAGLQDELSQRFSDALVRVNRFELNSIPQALIEARFCGDDPRVLDSLTQAAIDVMRRNPKVMNARNEWGNKAMMLRAAYSPVKAGRLGLGKADLMTAVKSTGDGTAVGIYRDGDKQVPVLLRTAGGNNLSQDGLGDLAVWNGRNSAPLAQLTDSIALAWEWPLVKTYNLKLLLDMPRPFLLAYKGGRLLLIVWLTELVIVSQSVSNRFYRDLLAAYRRTQQLEESALQARYMALQSQLNPHFLFNSLNTLIAEIEYNPQGAVGFTRNLSDVYRYILTCQDKRLVSLHDEMGFVDTYVRLHRVRLGDCLTVDWQVDDAIREEAQLPPLTLQLLVENIVKHNVISPSRLMTVTVEALTDGEESAWLRVSNPAHPKLGAVSGGHGLENLAQRYRLLCGKEIVVDRQENCFDVKVPLLYE